MSFLDNIIIRDFSKLLENSLFLYKIAFIKHFNHLQQNLKKKRNQKNLPKITISRTLIKIIQEIKSTLKVLKQRTPSHV